MHALRHIRLRLLILALLLAGCAGGSGSSGFDIISENAAIDLALEEQRCVDRDGLTICVADTPVEATPPDTPTVTRPATATPTVAPSAPSPTVPIDSRATPTPSLPGRPTATPTSAPTGTASPTFTPTPTREPSAEMRISLGLDPRAPISCVRTGPTCSFSLSFAPEGFPPDASYRIAARGLEPEGTWSLGPSPETDGPLHAPSFVTVVSVDVSSTDFNALPEETVVPIQLAVLVFFEPTEELPAEVQELAETGADFAFVTPALQLTVLQ